MLRNINNPSQLFSMVYQSEMWNGVEVVLNSRNEIIVIGLYEGLSRQARSMSEIDNLDGIML